MAGKSTSARGRMSAGGATGAEASRKNAAAGIRKTATARSPSRQCHKRCPHLQLLPSDLLSTHIACPCPLATSSVANLGLEGSFSRRRPIAASSCCSRVLLVRCNRSAVAVALARSRSERRRCSTSAMALSRGKLLKMSNCHSYCNLSPSSSAASSVSSSGGVGDNKASPTSGGPLASLASLLDAGGISLLPPAWCNRSGGTATAS
mmetsp:Transcript_73490/g.226919  ORF Transcript_73490/g.226919 Transcript_73490/m.226919 type:complete len:206 (-) Transcript_73490:241-858(-)